MLLTCLLQGPWRHHCGRHLWCKSLSVRAVPWEAAGLSIRRTPPLYMATLHPNRRRESRRRLSSLQVHLSADASAGSEIPPWALTLAENVAFPPRGDEYVSRVTTAGQSGGREELRSAVTDDSVSVWSQLSNGFPGDALNNRTFTSAGYNLTSHRSWFDWSMITFSGTWLVKTVVNHLDPGRKTSSKHIIEIFNKKYCYNVWMSTCNII